MGAVENECDHEGGSISGWAHFGRPYTRTHAMLTSCTGLGCRNCNRPDFILHAHWLGAAVMSSYTTPSEQQLSSICGGFP